MKAWYGSQLKGSMCWICWICSYHAMVTIGSGGRRRVPKVEMCAHMSTQFHRRDFIPMAYSVDGMAGKEARAAEKRLASLLSSKWDRPYSEMACFVKTRMSLSIVRSISMLLRGSRSSTWKRRAPDDGVAARASVTSQRW